MSEGKHLVLHGPPFFSLKVVIFFLNATMQFTMRQPFYKNSEAVLTQKISFTRTKNRWLSHSCASRFSRIALLFFPKRRVSQERKTFGCALVRCLGVVRSMRGVSRFSRIAMLFFLKRRVSQGRKTFGCAPVRYLGVWRSMRASAVFQE